MCSLRNRLEEQRAAAELSYRNAVSLMKQARGLEFERAWRLAELRRVSFQQAHQALHDHEQEHQCRAREAAATRS